MKVPVSNWMAATAMSLALATVAGCSAPEPDTTPPPPPPEAVYQRAPVDLAGAPAAAPVQDGLAGGPTDVAVPSATASMAPIPDPEDLPLAERHRIYGTQYDGAARAEREERVAPPARPRATAPVRVRAAPPRARPVAPIRPATIKPPAARPAVAVKTPVPQKPVSRPATAPAVAEPPLDPKLAKLQTALAPQVSGGGALTLSAPLSQRLEGPVTLSLPPNLFELIRREAAKLGLTRAAGLAEVSATLSGQGYDITPNGPQTVRLKSGEAASFQWQVRPGGGELGPLRAQIDAALRGQRTPLIVPLTAIEKTVTVSEPAKGFDLYNLGAIDVPGFGKTRIETLLGAALVLLAVVLLVALARNASEAEARARQRQRLAREAEAAASDDGAPRPKGKARAAETKDAP